jgi:hypothetical protein
MLQKQYSTFSVEIPKVLTLVVVRVMMAIIMIIVIIKSKFRPVTYRENPKEVKR